MRYLTSISLAVVVLMTLACAATPDIDATVEARLAQERAIGATVEARLRSEFKATTPSSLGPTFDINRLLAASTPVSPSIAPQSSCPDSRGTVANLPYFTHLDYHDRASVYMRDEKWECAIQDLDKAISIEPGYLSAYLLRGMAYSYTEQFGRSIQDFDKAVVINPNFGQSYAMRGAAYKLLGNNEQASFNFGMACQMDSDLCHLAFDTPRITTPSIISKPTAAPQRFCCKRCSKGKPCGNTCISRSKTCHVGRGCAC